jgi:hypothetical protein
VNLDLSAIKARRRAVLAYQVEGGPTWGYVETLHASWNDLADLIRAVEAQDTHQKGGQQQ